MTYKSKSIKKASSKEVIKTLKKLKGMNSDSLKIIRLLRLIFIMQLGELFDMHARFKKSENNFLLSGIISVHFRKKRVEVRFRHFGIEKI